MELAVARHTLAGARLPQDSLARIDSLLVCASGNAAMEKAVAQIEAATQLLTTDALRDVRDGAKTRIRSSLETLGACLRAPRRHGEGSATEELKTRQAAAASVSDQTADLVILEATDSVLPDGFSSFSTEFHDGAGATIDIRRIDSAELITAGGILDYTDRVVIAPPCSGCAGSRMIVADTGAFRADLLDHQGPFILSIRATDAQALSYANSAAFDLGRYHLGGALLPPASGGIRPDGVPVVITNQRNGLSFWTTTTSGGAIQFPMLLPAGVYLATGETVSNGVRYFADGAFVVDGDVQFSMRLRSLDASTTSATATVGR